MSDDLYNNLDQPVDTADGLSPLDDNFDNGQQFTTLSTPYTISNVEIDLYDSTPSDGTLTVALFSDAGDTPGADLDTLGTFSNSSLPDTSGGLLDVAFSGITLAADTQYWIMVEDSVTGEVVWNYNNGSAGTGVAGEYFEANNTSGSGVSNAPYPWIMSVGDTPCYCRGTRVLTERGEVAVEDLVIGDRLITSAGEARPLRWIGWRAYSGPFAARNRDILPIVIKRGALAEDVPARDLYVSPLHAFHLAGVLIPVRALVNGGSIARLHAMRDFEYFHLELDTHDLILAEGAAAETFLDDDNRNLFQNAADYRALYPEADPAPRRYCAPRLEAGELVAEVRERLALRGAAIGYRPPVVVCAEIRTGSNQIKIPPCVGELHLASRSRIGHGDRRRLGALLTGLSICDLELDLEDACLLRGFHQVEVHAGRKVRWTDGLGVIELMPSARERWCEIEVELVNEEAAPEVRAA